jgi:hypothetical protein
MLGSHLQDTVVILDMVEALVKVEAEAHVMVVPIEESLIMAEIVMAEIVMVEIVMAEIVMVVKNLL